ncbi:MAG: biopolymer transporter ExbD [Oligoflexales bacterium]|nr:biopolymer transporter ExbD [Oligoflexales bacterium]
MASVGGDSNDSVALNVMPMLDIFSILILFLLMNFSTDPMNHDLPEGFELPESKTTVSLDELPAITITRDQILVNDRKIVALVGGDVEAKNKFQGGIPILHTELEKLAEANKRFTSSMDALDKPGVLTMEVDKTHKFHLLKEVMLTAQQADFVEFKMMVSKEIE